MDLRLYVKSRGQGNSCAPTSANRGTTNTITHLIKRTTNRDVYSNSQVTCQLNVRYSGQSSSGQNGVRLSFGTGRQDNGGVSFSIDNEEYAALAEADSDRLRWDCVLEGRIES